MGVGWVQGSSITNKGCLLWRLRCVIKKVFFFPRFKCSISDLVFVLWLICIRVQKRHLCVISGCIINIHMLYFLIIFFNLVTPYYRPTSIMNHSFLFPLSVFKIYVQ